MYDKILDALIALDARITRLEELQTGSNDVVEALLRRPGHQPGDPAAPDVVRARALESLARRPGPIVDPAVADRVRASLELLARRPGPIVDPAVSDTVRATLEMLARRPGPIVDPAVADRVRASLELLARRPGPIVDPAVTDTVRATLEDIVRRNPGWFADPPQRIS